MTLCVGPDAHSKTCTYQAKDEFGVVVQQGTVLSSREELRGLARDFAGAVFVIEASAVHEWIYDTLTEHGVAVFATHPVNIRRATGKKNDEIDAGFLADAYRLGVLPPCYVPPKPIRSLRDLARRRAFLVQERTRFKNRVHAIMKRKGYRLVDDDGEEEEEHAAAFGRKRRARMFSFKHPEIPILLELVDELDEKKKDADKSILTAVRATPVMRRLGAIPGFGPQTCLTVFAEIGDVHRFRNADAMAAYFGLVPSESQSGESLVRGHITRKRSALARFVLTQAAWAHVRTCPSSSISQDYVRVARNAGKKRAIVMVARKLVKVAYWVWKEEREFTVSG